MRKCKGLVFLLLFFNICFASLSEALTNEDMGFPSKPIPPNIYNILLLKSDFPPNASFKMRTDFRSPNASGWATTPKPPNNDSYIQGLREAWFVGNTVVSPKYGYFATFSDSKAAAELSIFYEDSFLVNKLNSGSFSGVSIGEYCFSWFPGIESNRKIQSVSGLEDIAVLSFSKGNYTFLVSGSNKNGTVDRTLLESLALKVGKKIDIGDSLHSLGLALIQLISQQGILHSLQVKLDNFSKHYLKGEYSTALNNMNSFVNELDAQRGKHVSEQAYQTLKTLVDTIIANTNSLL